MSKTRLLIIRHGNTFDTYETPRRVGCKTDIPLVQSGIAQARSLGVYLKKENLKPDFIYSSELQRAQQTAIIMMREAGYDTDIQTDKTFNEIDHGLDENKTDEEIIERIGRSALDDWSEFGAVPDGWNVDPRMLQKSWIDFANNSIETATGKLTCVVSSGGVIRFSPVLLDGNKLPNDQLPKVKTASMGLFEHDGDTWNCIFWNKRP